MTTNQSAIERLRVELAGLSVQRAGYVRTEFVEAARAVLAEHDAAQKVPPSEAAKAWKVKANNLLHAYCRGDMQGTWLAMVVPHLDEAVRNWRGAEPAAVEPSEAAKEWLAATNEAIGRFGLVAADGRDAVAAIAAVKLKLDEAVRLMSQQPEAVRGLLAWCHSELERCKDPPYRGIASWRGGTIALRAVIQEIHRRWNLGPSPWVDPTDGLPQPEATKRLRPGWREQLWVAIGNALRVGYIDARSPVNALLDEAEASAAPEPEVDAFDIAAKQEVVHLHAILARANAIIDALLGRGP